MIRASLVCAALAAAAHASQPRAARPVAAPMRDLAWGQLNFLHTTDTHGWLAGHLREPAYSADWGDYVSLAHHLRARADAAGADLLLVDTGDRVDGSGLSDASRPRGRFQRAIFARQPVDIVTVGNHELYRAASADHERNTTVPAFADAYVASNVDYLDPATGQRVPLAPRFRRFTTRNQAIDVVAFGFLFDFAGNANNTVVQPVADAVKEPWFQRAMRLKPDVFVVAGHVGLRMDEFRTVFTALRKQNWHIPILFFGGHAHVRDALSYDSLSFSLASGRYLETIGWMSVDGIKPKPPASPPASPAASLSFTRKYMDNNLLGMYYHTGLNQSTFPTERGTRTSAIIADAREALALDERLGCAPRDLWINRAPFPGNDSIYSWLQHDVLPAVVVDGPRADKPRLVLVNTGGIRFDILKGPFTRDALFAVNPFDNRFRFVADVPYAVARKVLGILNSGGTVLAAAAGSDAGFLAIPQQMFPVPAAAAAAEPRLELRAVSAAADDDELTPGYTTKDDIGDDGDDTVHRPLTLHTVPNCIQAEVGLPADAAEPPPAVDVVFIDFLQPWMVPALKFAGGDYGDGDVRPYMDGTLADKMAAWIRDNWAAC